MRVLLIGGAGALGKSTMRALSAMGHDGATFDVVELETETAFDCHVGSVTDFTALSEVVEQDNFDAIVHLAGLLGAACDRDPGHAAHVNILGTSNVLEVARLQEIPRVVYLSSKAVYGSMTGAFGYPAYEAVSESADLAPLSLYGTHKKMAEDLGGYYAKRFGMEFIALRVSSIYGPGRGKAHSRDIIGNLIQSLVDSEGWNVPQGGDEENDFIHIDDVGRAIALAATAEAVPSGPYNVGTGAMTSLFDVAKFVRVKTGASEIRVGPGLNYYQSDEPSYCRFATEKAREGFGFVAQTDIYDGLSRFLAEVIPTAPNGKPSDIQGGAA